MKFFGAIPASAGRFIEFQFRDIHVLLGPAIRPVFTGGFLRAVRSLAPCFAMFVIAVFSVHCVKPIASLSAVIATKATKATKAASRGAGVSLGSPSPLGRRAGAAEQDRLYYEKGFASWYGGKHGSAKDGFAYKKTASGRTMNPEALICAHRTLPFGTIVIVENLSNGLSALLRVVDRGPFIDGRVVDVSLRAARELGILGVGVAEVRLRVAKDILRTNYASKGHKRPGAATKPSLMHASAPLAPFGPLGQIMATPSAGLKSLFVSPLNPFIPAKHSLSQAPPNNFGTFLRNAWGPGPRFKNLRLDPFINRKR